MIIRNQIKVFIILGILLFGIYYIATSIRKNELNNIEFINKDFKITKGIVTRKSVQKGNHLWVKYNVNGIEYIKSDGFIWYQKFSVGDTIRVKYSKTKPELMITEFNEYF